MQRRTLSAARRLTPLAAAAIACCAPWSAFAQSTPTELPRVDVISVTPLPGLGVPKDQVPGNVQAARAADIERSQALDLSSFMNRRLGSVHVNENQGNPFQPDLNFRGFTASPLLGTPQGLSVYVDGVRLNQPFGDVVSWDLIPKSAIAGITLMPGSNPVFGLNTLGGALSVQTKDGLSNPGSSVQLLGGSHGRVAIEFETGGSQASGLNWFFTGNRFHEQGWRAASPSDVSQLFGKVGTRVGDGTVSLTLSAADNDLTGNGLQEQRLLARDYRSVYTKPDNTKNRSLLLNLAAAQKLSDALSFSGNAYWRRIKTNTFNGDANDGSFDQSVYQPSAADRTALTAAGYTGFPTSGATAANTPFPYWRCIAQALIAKTNPASGEPAEKCSGVLNTTQTEQTNYGLAAQLNLKSVLGGLPNLMVAGAAVDISRVHFKQAAQLGYITSDYGVTPVNAFLDGSELSDDGTPDDSRVDLSARTRTWSVFASDTLSLNPQTHLTFAGRYNRTTVNNRDALQPGGGTGSLNGDYVFSRLNPAVGLTFAATPQLTAYAGLNQGSRAPSAVELGCADPASPCKLPNSFAGDPPLKQVVTTTFEAGLRGSLGAADTTWNLGIFRGDSRDDILFVADNQAGFGYFKNFGKTRRQGVEAGFSTRLAGVSLGANYTWLDATYQSTEVVNGSSNSSNDTATGGLRGQDGNITITPGNRIPLIPQHILKVFAELPLGDRWSVGADMTGVGGSFARGNENNQDRPDGTYYLGNGRSGGYAVFNLNADWRPTAGLKVFAQINNLFDRRYATAAQLGATAFDANGNFQARALPRASNGEYPVQQSTFYAPGAPRSVVVGLRYTFGQ